MSIRVELTKEDRAHMATLSEVDKAKFWTKKEQEAYEAIHRREDEQCAREYPVGATVYCVHQREVREGVVRRIERGKYDSSGNFRESKDGDQLMYVAEFPSKGFSSSHWERQSSPNGSFWAQKERAFTRLGYDMRHSAEYNLRSVRQNLVEARTAELTAEPEERRVAAQSEMNLGALVATELWKQQVLTCLPTKEQIHRRRAFLRTLQTLLEDEFTKVLF